MAKTPKEAAQSAKDQDLADELREDIQNAYSFIEGQRYTLASSTFTFEDAMDQFIERIAGSGPPGSKVNEVTRAKNVMAKLKAAVAKIKALPPSTFRRNSSQDVNK